MVSSEKLSVPVVLKFTTLKIIQSVVFSQNNHLRVFNFLSVNVCSVASCSYCLGVSAPLFITMPCVFLLFLPTRLKRLDGLPV